MDKSASGMEMRARSWAEWRKFRQRFMIYLVAAKKEEEPSRVKRAMLLATGGEIVLEAYNAQFDEKANPEFEEVLSQLEQIFKQGEAEHYAARVFRQLRQQPDEPFAIWLTKLKLAVKQANYGEQEQRMLRDQIIDGIHCNETRRELLKATKLSLQEAINICNTMEISKKQLQLFGEAGTSAVRHTSRGEGAPRGLADDGGPEDVFITARGPPKQQAAGSQQYRQQRGHSWPIQRRGGLTAAPGSRCARCGRVHGASTACPASGKQCWVCGKLNHFGVMCRKRESAVKMLGDGTEFEEEIDCIYAVEGSGRRKAFVPLQVQEAADPNRVIGFQVDCGATVNVAPISAVPKAVINRSKRPRIRVYDGRVVETVGVTNLHVVNAKSGATHVFECVLVQASLQPVIGKTTAEEMGLLYLDYSQIYSIETSRNQQPNESVQRAARAKCKTTEEIASNFPEVFDGRLGKLPGKVQLTVRNEVVPACNVACRVPPHLRAYLKLELEKLCRRGVIAKVDEPTEWVSRLSIQVKGSGELRLCLDPRRLNEALIREVYHTPALDEVLPYLSGVKVFSKFDLQDGFWHCELDEHSSRLTTFQTPFGRYRFLRLPFGLSVSPEIFFKRLVMALEGLEGVYALADDVLICGRGATRVEAIQDHDRKLCAFLERCRERGIRLNPRKTVLRAADTKFFGFVLTENGLQMDPDRRRQIATMQAPVDVTGLKSFLGMLSHIARFLPNIADTVAPLRELGKKGVAWVWGERQEKSFRQAVKLVASSEALAFYNPREQVEIECDASQTALGAVLLQGDRPVYFASRTLTSTEKKYAQIEKELLAVAYALERFHYFVYPKPVIVFTDHRPLVNIMGKALDDVPLRLQRMLMRIQRYSATLRFRPGREMRFADTLSRCPMKEDTSHHEESVNILQWLPMQDSTMKRIKEEAEADAAYQELREQIVKGWPENIKKVRPQLREYYPYRNSLTVEEGLILKGDAVVIPKALRRDCVNKVCVAHLSPQKMFDRAIQCVFWPRMKHDIRTHGEVCEGCQRFPTPQRKTPLTPHELPVRPWQKVGLDLAEVEGRSLVVLVCYYSNFIIVGELKNNPTTKSVLMVIRKAFTEFGVCDILVSDSDPLFRSEEWKEAMCRWGTQHVKTSPYHHQSNGKAEAAVAIVKRLVRRAETVQGDWRIGLMAYNDTPQQRLGQATPGELLHSRRLRTGLPRAGKQLRPSIATHRRVAAARQRNVLAMKRTYDRGARELEPLANGDVVRVKPVKLGDTAWKIGKITKVLPYDSFQVDMSGKRVIRNRRFLKKAHGTQRAENAREARTWNKQETRNQEAEAPFIGDRLPEWWWEKEKGRETTSTREDLATSGSDVEYGSAEEELVEGSRADVAVEGAKAQVASEAGAKPQLRPRSSLRLPHRFR